jgi:prevent-host-death family protein
MNMNIKTLSTTEARAKIAELVEIVSKSKKPIVIGRRNTPEAVLIPFPESWNGQLSEITNINAYSKSFDFLKAEPEIYSTADVKKKYV